MIPGQVVLTVDLRDLEQAKIDRFTKRFESIAQDIAKATATSFQFRQLVDSAPALADAGVMGFIDRSVAALGLTQQHMPSGAGHDAQEVARIAPMGMIFIPSINGISHSPKEFSKPEDITRGADVLLNAVLEADKS